MPAVTDVAWVHADRHLAASATPLRLLPNLLESESRYSLVCVVGLGARVHASEFHRPSWAGDRFAQFRQDVIPPRYRRVWAVTGSCGSPMVDLVMKPPPFESEYADSVLPTFEGDPATHGMLRVSADAEIPWTQMSVLLGTTATKAVQTFYLAKRFHQYFSDLPESDDRVGRAIGDISDRLMRLAVLDVAALNDGGLAGNDPGYSRTASLPTAHQRMKRHLIAANAPAADLDHLHKLRADINVDHHTPLKYVRHLRNKWAGHPSLDRRFDAWAGADKSLSNAAVEAALVRLVNNAYDTAAFVSSAPGLQSFRQPPTVLDPAGRIPMEMDLTNVLVWANLMRDSTGRGVRALRAQITSESMLERLRHTEAYRGKEY